MYQSYYTARSLACWCSPQNNGAVLLVRKENAQVQSKSAAVSGCTNISSVRRVRGSSIRKFSAYKILWVYSHHEHTVPGREETYSVESYKPTTYSKSAFDGVGTPNFQIFVGRFRLSHVAEKSASSGPRNTWMIAQAATEDPEWSTS